MGSSGVHAADPRSTYGDGAAPRRSVSSNGHARREGHGRGWRGLPGITIRLESESLQGVREISSSATGDFLAALLPAGEYTVTFQAGGMQTVSRSLTLRAGSTVRLDQRMRPSAVAESVDVAAEAASAGAPTGPAIEAELRQKQVIDRLPVDRSLRSIVLLAPGVADNGPHGNVGTTNDRKALMLSGALSYSNLFSIDGVVVNENLRGQPYDLFIEDAVEETTVSTGNISAEYGRFTGGVVNAITRSGGNDLKGSFRATLQNDRWTANDPFDRALGLDNRVDHVTESYEETLGGPAWKDRLWFFAAGRQAKLSDPGETRLVPRAGDDNPTPTAYVHSTDERRLEGKLTASPVSGYSLVASYTDVKFDENEHHAEHGLPPGRRGSRSPRGPVFAHGDQRERRADPRPLPRSAVLAQALLLQGRRGLRSRPDSGHGGPRPDPRLLRRLQLGAGGQRGPRAV